MVILLPSRAFNWRWCVIEYIYYTPREMRQCFMVDLACARLSDSRSVAKIR